MTPWRRLTRWRKNLRTFRLSLESTSIRTPKAGLSTSARRNRCATASAPTFRSRATRDFKLDHLLAEIADLEFIVVGNEMEALALENNLIKRHKPKFNILLRDDKTYPYIKLTLNEAYPRIYVTRRVKKDGALYFGPYFPASLAHRTFKLMSRYFQIRTCTIDIDGTRPRVCLDYHIKRCMGPCVASVCSHEEYASRVQDLKLFMEGKRTDLVKRLNEKMQAAATEERFELAAHLRDTVRTIGQLAEPQRISSSQVSNADVFALHREDAKAAAQLFHLRGGKVVDRREFFWEDLMESTADGEILSSLLKQYYFNSDFTPDEVFVPVDFEDRQLLEDFLSERKGKRVEIKIPQRGVKRTFRRPGQSECEAFVRPALSGSQSVRQRHQRRAGQRLGAGDGAAPHRVFRHLQHPGHRLSGLHGGLGRRQDEEERLPQVHHQDRGGRRRFSKHS